MNLSGKTAVITGASSGFGRAIAQTLDQAGMNLILMARRVERLTQLAAQLQNARPLPGDIASREMPQAGIDEAVTAYGRCDVVVNNAGILEAGSIAEIDLDRMSRMVRVNVEAAFRVSYTAVRHFLKAGSGHLVNISSVLGTKVRSSAGAYAGTKHALEALSEALRVELSGSPVKVSVIAPGMAMTELHDHMPIHPREALGIDRPLQPEDVAQQVRYVLQQPEHVRIARLLVMPPESPI